MAEPKGAERRESPRVAKVVPVRLSFRGADDFLRAFTENVSLGGLFVPTSVEVPVGSRVDLTVEVALGKGVRIGAEVVWQRPAQAGAPAGIGLRFVEMRDDLRAWLHAAVEREAEGHEGGRGAPREPGVRPAVTSGAMAEPELDVAGGGWTAGGGPSVESGAGMDAGGILGIDLGTSNSSVCVSRDGRPVILALAHGGAPGEYSIPSVVAYDESGRALVGQPAVERLQTHPRTTIYGAKRFVGRMYDHPEVQTMLSRFPYRVVPGAGNRCAVEVHGRSVSLVSVAAKILTTLREHAEHALGTPVGRAVITVPAFYNQNQRHAVVQAGRLAGLEVPRIVNEPTAAAVAYGLRYSSPARVLVYDLGGGTFDVSVMNVAGTTLTVLANAGDTFLGGEDFDHVIVGHVRERFYAETGAHLSGNHVLLAPLVRAAEQAKRRLTLHERTMVTIRDATLSNGERRRLEMEIDRAAVERLVEPLVARTLEICDRALAGAGLQRDAIDDVLLAGGQTAMPYVRKRVAEHFGREPRSDLPGGEVVALGAGILARLFDAPAAPVAAPAPRGGPSRGAPETGSYEPRDGARVRRPAPDRSPSARAEPTSYEPRDGTRLRRADLGLPPPGRGELSFRDVLSMSIGIGLPGGRFHKLIASNTGLPCRVAHDISIPARAFPAYALELYQGEAPELSRNEHLGTLRLSELRPGNVDPVPVRVELLLSPDCLLKVRVTNLTTDEDVDVLLDTHDAP